MPKLNVEHFLIQKSITNLHHVLVALSVAARFTQVTWAFGQRKQVQSQAYDIFACFLVRALGLSRFPQMDEGFRVGR